MFGLKDALFSALGTKDISAIGDESFADQRSVATSALEAIVVPVTIFERNESSAANTWKF